MILDVSRQSNMRTATEYRERQLERLPMALRRPGMFCGWYGDLYYRVFLDDLFWIDDRPKSDRKSVDELLFGPAGVAGKLTEQFPHPPDNFQNEVASIYAQAAFRLGYFHPQRLLTNSEFQSLSAALQASFFVADHTMSAITDQFGPPSHDVVGGQTTVLCYGCTDVETDWVYFDFSRCYPPEDRVTYQWFDEPLLRDVRTKRHHFELFPFAEWFEEFRADG